MGSMSKTSQDRKILGDSKSQDKDELEMRKYLETLVEILVQFADITVKVVKAEKARAAASISPKTGKKRSTAQSAGNARPVRRSREIGIQRTTPRSEQSPPFGRKACDADLPRDSFEPQGRLHLEGIPGQGGAVTQVLGSNLGLDADTRTVPSDEGTYGCVHKTRSRRVNSTKLLAQTSCLSGQLFELGILDVDTLAPQVVVEGRRLGEPLQVRDGVSEKKPRTLYLLSSSSVSSPPEGALRASNVAYMAMLGPCAYPPPSNMAGERHVPTGGD